jgi:hypothetical protein
MFFNHDNWVLNYSLKSKNILQSKKIMRLSQKPFFGNLPLSPPPAGGGLVEYQTIIAFPAT